VGQGLLLRAIVGHLVVDLQDVFQVVALGRDEEYACSCSFKVQGTIEVHILVPRLLRQWGLLDLCDNPPRKIPYYHLRPILWSLSNSKVSSCR
jgi:hypothetical protein